MIGWNIDIHTILLMIFLVLAVVYMVQNGNKSQAEVELESRELVPVKDKKKRESTGEQREDENVKGFIVIIYVGCFLLVWVFMGNSCVKYRKWAVL